MIYITYDLKTNYIHTVSSKKIIGISGDIAIAEVESIPNYDKSIQRLKATNIRTATDIYEESIIKVDDENNAIVDENGELIIDTVTKTREYTTCDFEVVDNEKALIRREIIQLETWFNTIYDSQVKQYQRCQRLGLEYDNKYGTIDELDSQADLNARRISELRSIL